MTVAERSANDHWSIRLLGGFGLCGPHGRVEVPPAGQRLVAYLAIQGHPVRRSTVAAAIWPDVDEARARANLRSTLSRVSALAPVVHATTASLGIPPDVVVDVEDLQLHVSGVRSGEPRSTGGRHGFDLRGRRLRHLLGALLLDDGQILGMNFYVKGIDEKIPGK